ncbi:MAG: phosphate ABC transporter permease subunit PstC [Gemmatimonadales bacterium]|nr:MAG: phosphate ABC transporter permease subunit PstC [Gemmatimonadales bacterium]
MAGTVILGTVLIAGELWIGSLPVWREWGLAFLSGRDWNPAAGRFGALPFVAGTLVTSTLALAMALPVSLGMAFLLVGFTPRPMEGPLVFLMDLLAALPSVVFGLWGIFVLVPLVEFRLVPLLVASPLGALPLLGPAGSGFSLLTAGLVLALMMIPLTAALIREALAAVPRSQWEGALALGCTRWEALRHVVLAQAKVGVWVAVGVGFGRALGETMAVVMTIGNRPDLTFDLLQGGSTLTAVIAHEFPASTGEMHMASLVALGLILLILSFGFHGMGRLAILGMQRRILP